MNEARFSPDDPQLTAYALGELEPEEARKIEAVLRGDPAARALVAAIRATADRMETALQAEVAEPLRVDAVSQPVISDRADTLPNEGGRDWCAFRSFILSSAVRRRPHSLSSS
jgi:anti-sigma factor RsiW